MSNRAQRRAAERASDPPSSPAVAPTTSNISDAQLNANRANAQMSTGPTTPAGKAVSRFNAVKTGLTGRTILLTAEDAVLYQQHLHRIFAEYAPATDPEKHLVQSILDAEWRLLRIAPLEAAIYIVGMHELGDIYLNERDPETRQALIQFEIFRTYRKELNNLGLQERRLRNMRKADIAELQALQQTRFEKEAKAKEAAKKNAAATATAPKPTPENGFVFSTDDLPPTPPVSTTIEPEIEAASAA
jgi:hypothetical protein